MTLTNVEEVPDSEEFTHFDPKPGSVTPTVKADYIQIEFIEGDNVLATAYLDYNGAKDLTDELFDVTNELWEKNHD